MHITLQDTDQTDVTAAGRSVAEDDVLREVTSEMLHTLTRQWTGLFATCNARFSVECWWWQCSWSIEKLMTKYPSGLHGRSREQVKARVSWKQENKVASVVCCEKCWHNWLARRSMWLHCDLWGVAHIICVCCFCKKRLFSRSRNFEPQSFCVIAASNVDRFSKFFHRHT